MTSRETSTTLPSKRQDGPQVLDLNRVRDELEYWVARGAADETELQEGHGAMNAYRAAVLREAAALLRVTSRQGHTLQEVATRIDRLAEEAESARALEY